MSITPFTLHVPDDELAVLADKLRLARLPREPTFPADDSKHRGAPLARVARVLQHWQHTYLPAWRERHERALNALPMFTVPVVVDGDAGEDGFGEVRMHFVHQRSRRANAVPLLFLHGWPGCFIESVKLLEVLKELEERDEGVAFHVVVPSLPNYGFSDEIKKGGFHLKHYAEACHKVMLALNYDEYVIQGGDWGSIIARLQARCYPQHVKAVHVNFVATDAGTVLRAPLSLIRWLWNWPSPARDWATLRRIGRYLFDGSGYFLMQYTRPQTVCYALDDSPVALLGWLLDKLIDWTDDYAWSDDEICRWLSIYWFSAAGPGASVRIYHETVNNVAKTGSLWGWVPQPLGVTQFPKDVIGLPSFLLPSLGRLVFESFAESGGHFAAYEKPEKLAADLNVMFGREGGAFGVVPGRTGLKSVEDKKTA